MALSLHRRYENYRCERCCLLGIKPIYSSYLQEMSFRNIKIPQKPLSTRKPKHCIISSHQELQKARHNTAKAPSKNLRATAGFIAVSQPRSGQGRMLSSLWDVVKEDRNQWALKSRGRERAWGKSEEQWVVGVEKDRIMKYWIILSAVLATGK